MKEPLLGAKGSSEEKGLTGSGRYASEELFRGKREIIITHGVNKYRLQITKTDKLILNK